ncbi:hypothetical protein D3C78_1060600 [compost metagenome]
MANTVEGFHSGVRAGAGGAENLGIVPVMFIQPEHGRDDLLVSTWQEHDLTVDIRDECRPLTRADRQGSRRNGRLLGLALDLGELRGRHARQVAQHMQDQTRTNRGELVRVANQDQVRVRWKLADQAVKGH